MMDVGMQVCSFDQVGEGPRKRGLHTCRRVNQVNESQSRHNHFRVLEYAPDSMEEVEVAQNCNSSR